MCPENGKHRNFQLCVTTMKSDRQDGTARLPFNLTSRRKAKFHETPHSMLIHTPSYGSALNITFLIAGHCLLKILVRSNCVAHWHTEPEHPGVCVLTASNHSYGLNTKQIASTNLTPGMATKGSHSQRGEYYTTQLFQKHSQQAICQTWCDPRPIGWLSNFLWQDQEFQIPAINWDTPGSTFQHQAEIVSQEEPKSQCLEALSNHQHSQSVYGMIEGQGQLFTYLGIKPEWGVAGSDPGSSETSEELSLRRTEAEELTTGEALSVPRQNGKWFWRGALRDPMENQAEPKEGEHILRLSILLCVGGG